MKTFLLVILLAVSFETMAQEKPDSLAEQYCLIRIFSHSFSGKVEVSADNGFGKRKATESEIMRDENGKKRIFLSEADALNYFGYDGWKLVNAFPVIEGRTTYTRYVFKRAFPVEP